MAKQSVILGYGFQKEIRPGVYAPDDFVEVQKVAEPLENFRYQASDKVSEDITTSDEISVIADKFACKNFSNIRYVKYMGANWKVASVRLRYPRIILTLGGVYNGRTASDGQTT